MVSRVPTSAAANGRPDWNGRNASRVSRGGRDGAPRRGMPGAQHADGDVGAVRGAHVRRGQQRHGGASGLEFGDGRRHRVVEGAVGRIELIETLCQGTQSVVIEGIDTRPRLPRFGEYRRRERIADRADQRLAVAAGSRDVGQPVPSRPQAVTDERGPHRFPRVGACRIIQSHNATDHQVVGVERPRVDHDRVDPVERPQRPGPQHQRVVAGGQTAAHGAAERFPHGAQRLGDGGQRGRAGGVEVAGHQADHRGGSDAGQADAVGIAFRGPVGGDRIASGTGGQSGRVVRHRSVGQLGFVAEPCHPAVDRLGRQHGAGGGLGDGRRRRQRQRGGRGVDEAEQHVGALGPEAPLHLGAQPRQVVGHRRRHGHQVRQAGEPQQAAGQRKTKAHSRGRGRDHSAHQQRIVARHAGGRPRVPRSVAPLGVGDDAAQPGGRGPVGVQGDHHSRQRAVEVGPPYARGCPHGRQDVGGDRRGVLAVKAAHLDPAARAAAADAPRRWAAERLDRRARRRASQCRHVRRGAGQRPAHARRDVAAQQGGARGDLGSHHRRPHRRRQQAQAGQASSCAHRVLPAQWNCASGCGDAPQLNPAALRAGGAV